MSERTYARWRDQRLSTQHVSLFPHPIPLKDPYQLTEGERSTLYEGIRQHNLVLYDCGGQGQEERSATEDEPMLLALCRQLGLTDPLPNPAAHDTGISRIEAVQAPCDPAAAPNRSRYIPYTTQRLNWHTDGYYNPPERRVRSFVLHCVRGAESGGENWLLDPEILYILLRDHSPALAHALGHPETLTIPADDSAQGSGRRAFHGPVFSWDSDTDALYTRFTRRRHHIRWRTDTDTQAALSMIDTILHHAHPAILRWTLEPGQGIVCHNVLHCRTAFVNPPDKARGRLVLRLRFPQRVSRGGPP